MIQAQKEDFEISKRVFYVEIGKKTILVQINKIKFNIGKEVPHAIQPINY